MSEFIAGRLGWQLSSSPYGPHAPIFSCLPVSASLSVPHSLSLPPADSRFLLPHHFGLHRHSIHEHDPSKFSSQLELVPSIPLVHIPERDRLISPVCNFEPGYPELASYGAAVIRMGYVTWSQLRTPKQQGVDTWDRFHGQLANQAYSVCLSPYNLMETDSAERLSSCHV